MLMQMSKLRKNCPEELKEEMEEIVNLSRKFWKRTKIEPIPQEYLIYIKIQVGESRVYLIKLVDKIKNLVISHSEELKVDLNQFNLDIGDLKGYIRKKISQQYEKMVGFSALLNYVEDEIIIWGGLVENPILLASQNKTNYVKILSKVVQNNANDLAQSIKEFVPKQVSTGDLSRFGAKIGKKIDKLKGEESEEQVYEEEADGLSENSELELGYREPSIEGEIEDEN